MQVSSNPVQFGGIARSIWTNPPTPKSDSLPDDPYDIGNHRYQDQVDEYVTTLRQSHPNDPDYKAEKYVVPFFESRFLASPIEGLPDFKMHSLPFVIVDGQDYENLQQEITGKDNNGRRAVLKEYFQKASTTLNITV